MKSILSRIALILVIAWAMSYGATLAAESPTKALIDPAAEGAEKRLEPQGQATVAASKDPAAKGIVVTIPPGIEGYPGVLVKPEGAATFDLSAFGHVEARLINTGAKDLSVGLRVDNAGPWTAEPWNTEQMTLKPGEGKTIRTTFGYQHGGKPGHALEANKVVGVLVFAIVKKSTEPQSFRIESLVAGGTPGEKPLGWKPPPVFIRPKDGAILGRGVVLNAEKQVVAKGGAQASADGQALKIVFPAKADASVGIKAPGGENWNLSDYLEVRVAVRNDGKTPVTPRVGVENTRSGRVAAWTSGGALAPGARSELVIPFMPAVTWKGVTSSPDKFSHGQKGTGSEVHSNAIAAVTVSAEKAGEERTLVVESITAVLPPPPALPDWLGKRPPVEGDWVQTLNDNFDGPEIDASVWSIYGPNYWDKKSHWSKDNTILGGGVVKLRYEKKRGLHNDGRKEWQTLAGTETNYQGGFLESHGRWVQRYGYFEARMKLPRAPGLWPAFWMMPDRGVAAGPSRGSTGQGGMEFDVMEHLTGWGPYRYNIATHWDGYGKDHKSTGTETAYVQADKDGFITAGLLWLPGQAVWYCNGREVARWEDERISNVPSDLMFTLPQGGWDNLPIDDARLPDDFVIDYVRVWQRKDLASAVDGKQVPAAAKPAAK